MNSPGSGEQPQEDRLPPNAQPQPQSQPQVQQAHNLPPVPIKSENNIRDIEDGSSYPQSISGSLPKSFSHATEVLASGSPPPPATMIGSISIRNEDPLADTDDDDAASSRMSMVLSEAEAARRLKRHLVTRPLLSDVLASSNRGSEPRSYGSISLRNEDSPADTENDGDFSGEDGEDGDDEDESSRLVSSSHAGQDEEVTVDPFTLPSGDITHHLYRWQAEHGEPALLGSGADSSLRAKHGRNRSFSAVASDSEWDMPYTPDQIRAPGGFRRQFVHDRALRDGRQANILTANFVDFIGLYGHFAGGDYPSDEDDDDEEEEGLDEAEAGAAGAAGRTPSERAQLLRATKRKRRDMKGTASTKKTFFLLVKAFIGTGVLVLPRAFFNGGLTFSTILMSTIAWYALHCMILLSDVYQKLGGSYGDLALKLYGKPLKYCVMVSIVLAQLGFCCAYLIFVATNMQDLWNTLTSCKYQISAEKWILVQLLLYVPLAFVRKIKKFASLSMVGNVFILFGLGYLLYYNLWSLIVRGPAEVVHFNPSKFPLLVGTAAFSYEGISLVIPIVESMEKKEQFNKVLTASLTICAGVFVVIGAMSYLTFGEKVEAVILLNLPNDSVWTLGVQLLYSLAIMMSVPLQLFPAIRIIESGIFTRSGKGNPIVKWQKNLFRTLLVGFIAMVAIFGAEKLDNFIAIVGASSCLPLSFLYPVMLHYRALASGWWAKTKDMVLILIALFGLVYVTYISIETWGATNPPLDRCAGIP